MPMGSFFTGHARLPGKFSGRLYGTPKAGNTMQRQAVPLRATHNLLTLATDWTEKPIS
jgi:hypothetical protein